jgi:hypothetical protein
VLSDLAVAVEAWSMACGNDTACLAGAACDACCAFQAGAGCGCGGCGVSVEHVELAVAAAERLVRFFAARSLCSCSRLARELLAALQMAQSQQTAAAMAGRGCNAPAVST